ncbi:MAG: hypothetical protein LBF05_04920 [Tannerella sp.]|nr:hypothetical protein [Tannerella sp.]
MATDIKKILYRKLLDEHCFWSYDLTGVTHEDIPDEIIIEKTLLHLDIYEITLLFKYYGHPFVKEVWRERLAVQGDCYRALNRFLALYCFKIKNPDRYLKAVETKHLKKYA